MDRRKREQFRDHLYEVFAGTGKALGNGRRLVILDLLCQAERNVEGIAGQTGMTVGSVSQHLQLLRAAGLVKARRRGARVYYRVANAAAAELWYALRAFGETELPAIDRIVDGYLSGRDELEAIDADELRARMRDGSVLLIDVRPAREFDAAHIDGALSIPVDELEAHLDELPEEIEIVAYCRGRYCVFADDAVRTLREHGFRARRLEFGVADWERLQ